MLVVFVIMLLRNRKEESGWSESFEVCSCLITAVRNIFIHTKIQMDDLFLEQCILYEKCDFLKWEYIYSPISAPCSPTATLFLSLLLLLTMYVRDFLWYADQESTLFCIILVQPTSRSRPDTMAYQDNALIRSPTTNWYVLRTKLLLSFIIYSRLYFYYFRCN